MDRKTWKEKLIGSKLPPGLANIEWKSIGRDKQEIGDDSLGNEWIREAVIESSLANDIEELEMNNEYQIFDMWTTLCSEYREAIFIPVFVRVKSNLIIESIRIDAYFSCGPCHGRPGYLDLQKREENQIGRMFKELSNR